MKMCLEILITIIDSIHNRAFSCIKKGVLMKHSGIIFKKFEKKFTLLTPFYLSYFNSEDAMNNFLLVFYSIIFVFEVRFLPSPFQIIYTHVMS